MNNFVLCRIMKLFSYYVLLASAFCSGEEQDLFVAENGIELKPGSYFYRTITIPENRILALQGGVTLVCEKLVTAEGAQILYSPIGNSLIQVNIFIEVADASEMKFLYIHANGKDGLSQEGPVANGISGRNAYAVGHSFGRIKGRSSQPGGTGSRGAPGGNGTHAANIEIRVAKVREGSLLRIHANGGNGGDGQNGGRGGQGGRGASGHPASKGGTGGAGGDSGNGGNAGRISLSVAVSDRDFRRTKPDLWFNKFSFEFSNVGGKSGNPGTGGAGGPGGSGGLLGGDGNSGKSGTIGAGGARGVTGKGTELDSEQRWIFRQLLAASDFSRDHVRIIETIQKAHVGDLLEPVSPKVR